MKNNFLLLIILSIVFYACSQSEESVNEFKSSIAYIDYCKSDIITPDDYIQWVDAKFSKQVNYGNVIYELKYIPVEYKLLKNSKYKSIEAFNKDVKEFSNSQYFTFRISVKDYSGNPIKYNLVSENEYYARVEYLSFGILNDICLIENEDSLFCKLNNFERSYNLDPYITESFSFDKVDTTSNGDKVFIYNDRLFGNGIIKFRFSNKELNNSPKIGF